MPRRRTTTFAFLASVVALAITASSGSAAPVCSTAPQAACGGRIFAEPELSASFVQHDLGEYRDGLFALEKEFPRFVKVRTLAQVLKDPKAKSAGGRDIYLIEITDFKAPERRKVPVAVSLSVHGPERAGLEGGVRYAEDLARWASQEASGEEPGHELRNGRGPGTTSVSALRALRGVHLYMSNINPDGWAKGDLHNGGVFQRGNNNGKDLNRQFPTLGWTRRSHEPMTQIEAILWDRLLRRVDPALSADLHGELTSANGAFADLMLPAGQWNPRDQSRQERLAKNMKSNIERYFAAEDVVLADIAGAGADMVPAEYATAYDVVGYDDSGFMGDYLTQRFGAIDMDVEHFLSHMVPNSLWITPLEQAHVAAVRAEIETLVVEALVHPRPTRKLNLGRVGYLFDPEVVRSGDGYGGPSPPPGVRPKSYRATRMRYFADLSRWSRRPLRRVLSADVARGGLQGLDSLVVADEPFPRDPRGREVSRQSYLGALRRWVAGGGNLVLTDEAVKLVADLGIVPGRSISMSKSNAGHVEDVVWSDRYADGVHHTASQTYYEVTIGYPATNEAPHWTVDKALWEDAGGKHIAHAGLDDHTVLGRIRVGAGTVGFLGAVLPQPTEAFDHYFGLADYAVTVAGGQILNNMISRS